MDPGGGNRDEFGVAGLAAFMGQEGRVGHAREIRKELASPNA